MIQEIEFLTVAQVSEIFGCHCNTIRKAIRKGFIVAIRVGEGKRSAYRISRRAIDKIHVDSINKMIKRAQKT